MISRNPRGYLSVTVSIWAGSVLFSSRYFSSRVGTVSQFRNVMAIADRFMDLTKTASSGSSKIVLQKRQLCQKKTSSRPKWMFNLNESMLYFPVSCSIVPLIAFGPYWQMTFRTGNTMFIVHIVYFKNRVDMFGTGYYSLGLTC